MAGILAHLMIANEVANTLNKNSIKSISKFNLGVLAPDAVQMRANYSREIKKKAHFRTEISDLEADQYHNITLFNSRVKNFLSNYYEIIDTDFLRGYLVHVLTDYYFLLTLYKTVEIEKTRNVNRIEGSFYCKTMEHINRLDNYISNYYKHRDYFLKLDININNVAGVDDSQLSEIKSYLLYADENFIKNQNCSILCTSDIDYYESLINGCITYITQQMMDLCFNEK